MRTMNTGILSHVTCVTRLRDMSHGVTSLRDSHASHEGDGPLPGLGAPGVQLGLDAVGREDRHQARHRGRRQQEQHLEYVILIYSV